MRRVGLGLLALITLLPSIAFLPGSAIAGAWTQPPGHLYARLTHAGIDSHQRFDDDGNRIGLENPGAPRRETEYRGREFRLYAEYGLWDGFTATTSFAVQQIRVEEPLLITRPRILPEVVHQTTGISDVYLGGRVRVLRGRQPVSLSGEMKIPGAYSTRDNPSLGNGQIDVTLRALAGGSAGWIYSTADAGWTYRGGGYQNEALFTFELGGRVLRYYTWRGVVRGVRSLGETRSFSNATVFDPALSSPHSLVLEAVVGDEIRPGLDLEAGISHVASGRNTLAGNTLQVGLAWSMQWIRKR